MNAPGKALIVGATGMVGQAMVAEAEALGFEAIGAARSGAAIDLDVLDDASVERLIDEIRPRLIVNCAALVALSACEERVELAYRLNARAVAVLAGMADATDAQLIQISTDQYFTGDGDGTHREDAQVTLLNEYARTKHAGETFALTSSKSLVVRTNVTGFRRRPDAPTFIEWAINSIESGENLELFGDYYTSTIDATALARASLELALSGTTGLVNVASREVSSKQQFLERLAERLGCELNDPRVGSVRKLVPQRAESTGLDVDLAERALGRQLPTLDQTLTALLEAA